MTTHSLVVAALALGLVLVAAPGCASFAGARLYRSGSQALERGDAEQAIADLERAAELVPHASEVQNHLGLAYAAAANVAPAGGDGSAVLHRLLHRS